MSQNSHTLLLFCKNAEQFKACLTVFNKLEAGDEAVAALIADKLGIDIADTWNEDWFNHAVSHGPAYIRLNYDSATGYDMPLELLRQLFSIGLKAACLEVFYSQVGEHSRFHFRRGALVSEDDICRKFPKLQAIIAAEFEGDSDELEGEGYPRPCTIRQLINDKKQADKDATAMVDGLRNIAKLSRETGENPIKLLKTALQMSAVIKGVIHAVIFGVVTILLFKGIWLWIVLTLLLLFALPLLYVANLEEDLDDDDSGDGSEAEAYAN